MSKELKVNKIYQGDSLEVLKTFPDESVDMIITSPPYWGLRNYGTGRWEGGDPKCKHKIQNNLKEYVGDWDRPSRKENAKVGILLKCQVCGKTFKGKMGLKFCSLKCLNTLSNDERTKAESEIVNTCKCGAKFVDGQIGLEPTIVEHVDAMFEILTECKRVLVDYGTLWLNYGDTYYGGGGYTGHQQASKMNNNPNKNIGTSYRNTGEIKRKSMGMIPERIAIKLVDNGWVLRNKIIWHKPSVVPQSAKDRFTNDWEYIYFFAKKPKGYYFEQQFEECKSGTPQADNDRKRMIAGRKTYGKGKHNGSGLQTPFVAGSLVNGEPMRNMRSVWKVSSQAVKEAHFATFPFKLIERPIKAGCPELVCTGKQSPARKIKKTEFIKNPNDEMLDMLDRKYVEIGELGKRSEDYERHTHGIQTLVEETLIDGCGKPVVKVPVKKVIGENPKTGGDKYDWHECNSGEKTKIYTIEGSDLIDGCGQPVKKVVEKKFKENQLSRKDATKPNDFVFDKSHDGTYTIEEHFVNGCGQPVKKVFEKEYSPDKVDRAGKKALETRANIGQRGDYTIEETQIDGCGKPVIPVIEIETEKVSIRPESGYRKRKENDMVNQDEGCLDSIVRIPVRKPTTTATHCSCGALFRKGIVLDPFMGSGTTAIVARALDRDFVGIELNPEYIKIANKRLKEWTKDKVLDKLNGKPNKKKRNTFKPKKDKSNPLI